MQMNNTTNIFHDLEIPTDGIMDSAEQFDAFFDEVTKAAKSLEEILDSRENVGSIEDGAKSQYRSNPEFKASVKEQFGSVFDGIYKLCEEIELPEIYGVILEMKSLTESLENLLHDRAKAQAVSATDSLQNKKLAQIQHKRLREQWDALRKFAKLWFGVDYAPIKAKPGNYAASSFRTYAYILPGEGNEPLYNVFAVAKFLGIYYNDITFKEIMDYCLANPDKVSVTEVTL